VLPLKDNVPTRTTPYVTIGLIVANFVVWFWELGGRGVDYHVFEDGFYPCTLHGPCHVPAPIVIHPLPWYEGVFSGMFMHASWQHILGNMLFLWIFGNNVEDVLGRLRYLLWYLAGGIAAMAVQTFVTLHEAGDRVQAASIPNVGASGAIAAVLGAYFILYPNSTVFGLIVVWPVRVSAMFFLGFWFLYQLFEANFGLLNASAHGGGTAFFAHVGGFVFGVIVARILSGAGRIATRDDGLALRAPA